MSDVLLNIKLRPIKFAFLVNPNDKKSILEAIQANTFLWGGIYNPIIPVFKRFPASWKMTNETKTTFKKIIEGYIDTFDPDFIVTIESNIDRTINFGNRKVLSITDVFVNFPEKKLNPQYGIGIFEVFNKFIEEELKFVRQFPYEFIIFNFNKDFSLFFKCVFGDFKNELMDKFLEYYSQVLKFDPKDCNIDYFGEYFKNQYQFLRRISEKFIKFVQTRHVRQKGCIYILDAQNNMDIIDYWNLRAIGWEILPLPVQSINDETLINHITGFIEQNFYLTQENPPIYNETRILKSRSIKDDVFKKISDLLKTKNNSTQKIHHPKMISQFWFPRMWNEWAREKDNVEFCLIESRTKSLKMISNNDRINFEILKPKFETQYYQFGPQFANEIEFNMYGDGKELYANIIPECDIKLINAFDTFGFDEWRFSRNGMIYLSKYNKENINLGLPKAERVFEQLLKYKDIEIEISKSGNIAKQMIKYIDGIWNVRLIANKKIMKLLLEMGEGKIKSYNQIMQAISGLFTEGNENKLKLSLIKNLTEKKIIQFGFVIECPLCFENHWFSLTEVDYIIKCPNCLEKFQTQIFSQPDLRVSYKTLGPFSLKKHQYGVYSDLLTARFFSNVLHNPTSIITGFNILNNNKVDIELDLGVLCQNSYSGSIELLFAECKTFNQFEKKDIERLKIIGEKIPGSILVFSTLNKELTSKEKKLILPLVKKELKNRKMNKPYNPVLILTEIELFGDNQPPYSWKDLDGKYQKYVKGHYNLFDLIQLCHATQEIYLDFKQDSEVIRVEVHSGFGKFIR